MEPNDISELGLMDDLSRIEDFWSRVKRLNPEECWEWQSTVHKGHGYGTFAWKCLDGKWRNILAHRLAFLFSGGKFTNQKRFALHSCHNRKCCNPSHLRAGDYTDNAQDKIQAGRGNLPKGERWIEANAGKNQPRGERSPNSVFTDDKIIKIRYLYTVKKLKLRPLAEQFECSISAIQNVVKYRTWRHVHV